MAIILDNGCYTCKVGFSNETRPRLMLNSIIKAKSERRTSFISNQINDCKDLSGIFYLLPLQKGFLIDWDLERQIWDYIFSKENLNLNVEFQEHNIVITEPHFNFTPVRKSMAEVVFEEFQFKGFYTTAASTLSSRSYLRERNRHYCVVIDSGFSFTHVVPYCHDRKLARAVRRIDVGGKLITNHMKDLISYRQLNVMDETYVVNQLKEGACFVSKDFFADMELAKNSDRKVSCKYVLPDFQNIKQGYIQDDKHSGSRLAVSEEQIVKLKNERFTVPEVLFNPSYIGINQIGISEAIVNALDATPREIQPLLYKNIILTGGNAKLPGFKERIFNDVRSITNADFDVQIFSPEDPVTYAWECGAKEVRDGALDNLFVSRKEYEEFGYNICRNRFF
ncbi:Actin-related protein 6 [Trichoplax sp. H2]|nr:Actin-related protein 6 [Trichoplax sp. H2]|eukprot:RDD41168.1 Actin-related protein 6 [Trichoplax sp. H2]